MKLIDVALKTIKEGLKTIAILLIALILAPFIFWGTLHVVEWTLRNSDANRPPHTPFYNYDDKVSYCGKYECRKELAERKKELNIGSSLLFFH